MIPRAAAALLVVVPGLVCLGAATPERRPGGWTLLAGTPGAPGVVVLAGSGETGVRVARAFAERGFHVAHHPSPLRLEMVAAAPVPSPAWVVTTMDAVTPGSTASAAPSVDVVILDSPGMRLAPLQVPAGASRRTLWTAGVGDSGASARFGESTRLGWDVRELPVPDWPVSPGGGSRPIALARVAADALAALRGVALPNVGPREPTNVHRWTRRAVAGGCAVVLAAVAAALARWRPGAGSRAGRIAVAGVAAAWVAAAFLTVQQGWGPDVSRTDPHGDRADAVRVAVLMDPRWGTGWTSAIAEPGVDPRWRRDLWMAVREAAGRADAPDLARGEVAWRLRAQVRLVGAAAHGTWFDAWLARTLTPA